MSTITCGYDSAGTQKTHATLANAIAAASNNDLIEVYYSDAYKNNVWHEYPYRPVVRFSMRGMTDPKPIFTGQYANGQFWSFGSWGALDANLYIDNITILNTANTIFIDAYFSSGTGTVFIQNCTFVCGIFRLQGQGASVTIRFENCHFLGCGFEGNAAVLYRQAGILEVYFCTFLLSTDLKRAVYGTASTTAKNNIAIHGPNLSVGNMFGGSTLSNNISQESSDSTQITFSQYRSINSLASMLDVVDLRPDTADTVVIGSGVAIAGITTDIDGQARPNPPAIGCSEGITLADLPDVTNVLSDDTVGGVSGTYVGPSTADVQNGVQYGAGGTEYTGTFVAPAEADVQSGVTYGNAAEFTGTFVVPAEEDVESGVEYGNSAEFTGTLNASSGVTAIIPIYR